MARKRAPSVRPAALVAAMLSLLPASGQAIDLKYQLGMAASHSDNIGLLENNETGDTILAPMLRFEASHDSSALRLSATGRAEYLHYTGNSYDDEFRGELTGKLDWELVPERLHFVANDWLIRQPVDVLTNFVPTNQQEVNVFLAGPSLYGRFSDSTRAQVDLRYGNTYAQEARDFNGDRFKVAARLLHDFSPTTTGSVNFDATRVEFDNNGELADYTRYGVYVGFARTLASFDLSADLGAARIDRRTGPGESAPTVRLRLDWRAAPRSIFGAAVDFELGDAAQYTTAVMGALGEPTYEGLTNADLAAGPAIFRSREFQLSYTYKGERLGFRIYPQYQRFDFLEDSLRQQIVRSAGFEASYLLRPRVTLVLSGEREVRDFEGPDRRDTGNALRLSLAHELTRHWMYRLDVQHRQRNSTAPGLSHDVNEVALAVIYSR